ncbi:MAG TPA: beta-ketoacyl synthase N-terminal-like domain-containing protein, partial [Dehalococcoidales bacterium]|nr:beta-ketoacyl synthase N-terminal-like domain-containing protein [Dehalococcoidales bacterium]
MITDAHVGQPTRQLPKVVVTGIGAVCSIGLNIPEMWPSLIAGKSGVDYLTAFDTTKYETKIGAEVKN